MVKVWILVFALYSQNLGKQPAIIEDIGGQDDCQRVMRALAETWGSSFAGGRCIEIWKAKR